MTWFGIREANMVAIAYPTDEWSLGYEFAAGPGACGEQVVMEGSSIQGRSRWNAFFTAADMDITE